MHVATESCKEMGALRAAVAETLDLLKFEHRGQLRSPELAETEVHRMVSDLRQNLLDLSAKILTLPKEIAVLRRLSFEAMFWREDAVLEPTHGTFDWILEQIHHNERQHTTDNDGKATLPDHGQCQNLWQNVMENSGSVLSDDLTDTSSQASLFATEPWPKEAETSKNASTSPQEPAVNCSEATMDWREGFYELSNGNIEGSTETQAAETSNWHNTVFSAHGDLPMRSYDFANQGNSSVPLSANQSVLTQNLVQDSLSHLDHMRRASERAIRRQISESFASFLRNEDGVFFCFGKAGSGKSTFMKHISSNKKTLTPLREWAGAKILVLVNIFFWNSGDELQMSMEGFYRSLLFQVVQKCPDIVTRLFPTHTLTGNDHTQGIREGLLPFRFPELQDAVSRLLKTSKFSRYRFCFFIDGLDEFKGDSVDHFQLARSLRDWASQDVKIVCSARPYTEFLDTFTDPRRMIQLDLWTLNDIDRYALAMLRNGPWSGNSKGPWIVSLTLARLIAKRADGVFLWARLVVRSLLDGIAHGDSFKALYDRVEHAPLGLNKLYGKILDSIDSTIRRRAEHALLLAISCPFHRLSGLSLTWLDDLNDANFPMNQPFRIYSEEELCQRQNLAKRQVALLTRGLLEIRHGGRIDEREADLDWSLFALCGKMDYHHQSTKDFLMSRTLKGEEHSEEMLRDIYARICLAELKFAGTLWNFMPKFQQVYRALADSYHPVPDQYLDMVASCFPLNLELEPGTISYLGILNLPSSRGQKVGVGIGEFKSTGWRRSTLSFVVWKGPDQDLLICYALLMQQSGYVLRRLQRGAIHNLTEEELSVWLFCTWTIFPDPRITEFVLSVRGLPQAPIQARNNSLNQMIEVSCWPAFLMAFCKHVTTAYVSPEISEYLFLFGERHPRPLFQGNGEQCMYRLCEDLEHLLRHVRDQDAVVLLRDTISDPEPNAAANLSQWEIYDYIEYGVCRPKEDAIFYVDIWTMVKMIQPPPPNLTSLMDLLGESLIGRLRAAATYSFAHLLSSLGYEGTGELLARRKYKPANLDDWRSGRLVTHGILSRDGLLMGPLSIAI